MVVPQIKQEELHIWWANLRDFDSDLPSLQSVLSPWEQARAERFRFLRDRDNYIICHGILRMLLGSYVGQSPSDLSLTIGACGKPELRAGSGGGGIHFNLSHSRDLVLCGITGACPIGVDVEYLQPIPRCERIAREFFSQTEAESLRALPREFRTQHFFDLWTRKEALLKATGDGLGHGQTIRHAFLSEPQASDLTDESMPMRVSAEWRVRSFSPTPGYIAAVAFRNPNLDLSCRTVPAFFSEVYCGSRRRVPRNPEAV